MSSGVYLAVFGPANEYTFFYLLAIWLVACAVDVVAIFVLKGWANRVLAIAGAALLLVPIAVGLWVGQTA